MSAHRIFAMAFAAVYPAYLNKAERKDRTKAELDRVICWLTGYDGKALRRHIELKTTIESFFAQTPAMIPNGAKITGMVCGVRVKLSRIQ